MKKFIVTAIAVTFLVSVASSKVTTETLYQEYNQIQKRVSDDQQTLLRLEGAIRVLEMNAETTATETLTTSTKIKN